MKKIESSAGRDVDVHICAYHVATIYDKEKEVRVAFWEVAAVEKLECHYAPQQEVYHVTDVASLATSSKAVLARDAMLQVKRLRRGERTIEGFQVKSTTCSVILQATVAIY